MTGCLRCGGGVRIWGGRPGESGAGSGTFSGVGAKARRAEVVQESRAAEELLKIQVR